MLMISTIALPLPVTPCTLVIFLFFLNSRLKQMLPRTLKSFFFLSLAVSLSLNSFPVRCSVLSSFALSFFCYALYAPPSTPLRPHANGVAIRIEKGACAWRPLEPANPTPFSSRTRKEAERSSRARPLLTNRIARVPRTHGVIFQSLQRPPEFRVT